MKIVTAAEMRRIDRVTTEKFGVPSLTLMENAGIAVAHFVMRQYPDAKRITVVCGNGNNGGDGFVAARKLHDAGREITVALLSLSDQVKGDAGENLKRLPHSPIVITSSQELAGIANQFRETDLILDAIFGTGFHPPLPELAARAIEMIHQSSAPVISVDIPSGADADSFELDQPHAARSSAIVTFTAPKPGIIFSTLTRGPIVVADIGSPADAIVSKLGLEWNGPPDLLRKERPLNSNKGLYGHALVIGGSVGKSGAPTMSSTAALRIGAGLVTCAIPKSILPIVASAIPELMTEPLDENDAGALSSSALDDPESRKLLERKNVVALGPGVGRDPDTVSSIRKFASRCPLPLVLDADGLNAFEQQNNALNGGLRPLVLTPHPGEMSRLIGKSVKEIEAKRIEVARTFAREHKLILVLKGWRTLIADAIGNVWVNTTGNPGLAKGGSGDVLTGLIAGMIAQYPNQIADAVRAAVHLHGLGADYALRGQTERTMLATDLLAGLPQAFRSIERGDDLTWIQGEAQRR
jgi:ADP-dependent NAD(P)H-hydrate dehydratase / NAD(P)H-hydrate epimerase